jgi:serine/threonine-protein kinase
MEETDLQRMAVGRLGLVLKGKYKLDQILGIGGMAVVYAATHRNSKRFAVKMLHPDLSRDPELRGRFLREGYLANSVGHPGAVAVLDDDVADDGSVFVVMELLEGSSVDEVWAKYGKRVPLELVLSMGDALLDLLAAAHAKGVVHRDIKPANLFLTNDGHLRVLDFGIAQLHDGTPAFKTLTGSALGTPGFMAPEQALGDSTRVDGQTDVFSVGATLFFLLSGHLVHEGDTTQRLLVSAATQKARRLSSLTHGVPSAVASVIDRALAFDKKDRFRTAQEMQSALRQASLEATDKPIRSLPRIPVAGAEDEDEDTLSAGRGQRPALQRRSLRGRLKQNRRAALGLGAAALGTLALIVALRGRAHPALAGPGPGTQAPSGAGAVSGNPGWSTRALTVLGPEDSIGAMTVEADGGDLFYVSQGKLWHRELAVGADPRPLELPAQVGAISETTVENLQVVGGRLFVAHNPDQLDEHSELWEVGQGKGGARRVLQGSSVLTVSPDGTRGTWCKEHRMYLGDLAGGRARDIGSCEDGPRTAWAPSSTRVAELHLAVPGYSGRLTIESVDGARSVTVFEGPGLGAAGSGSSGLAFRDDHHLLFMRYEGKGPVDSELDEVELDDHLDPVGPPRLVYRWAAATISDLRLAGSRIVFIVTTSRDQVQTAALGADGRLTSGLSTRISETSRTVPLGWTTAGDLVVSSNRSGAAHLYRAPYRSDGGLARLTGFEGEETSAVLAGGDILLVRGPVAGTCALVRLSASSNRERPLAQFSPEDASCGEAICAARAPDLCLLLQRTPDGHTSLRRLNAATGKLGATVATSEGTAYGAISPDGAQLVVTHLTGTLSRIDLATDIRSEIPVRPSGELQSAAFLPDGAHLLIAGLAFDEATYGLISTDLQGNGRMLQTSSTGNFNKPIVSPDGAWLGVEQTLFQTNIWLLEPR